MDLNARTRIDGIDVLRGLAIFFVLTNHVNMRLLGAHVPYAAGIPKQLLSSLVWNGQYGVQMFFAVSGFLITATSLRRWGPLPGINARNFYRIRFARIAPTFLLLLIILTALHLGGVTNFVVRPKTGGLGRALLAALTFHVNLLEARRGYLPANWDVLWSLSIEELFYLFFPPACRILGRWLTPFLLLLIVLGPFARTVFAGGNEIWREYSYLGGMDAIALGCLTALWVSRKSFSKETLRVLAAAGAFIVVCILCFSLRLRAMGLARTGLDMTSIAAGTCMLCAASAQSRWLAPRFLAPLLALGRRSYEIYLSHMFVVFACFGVFLKMGKPLAAVPALFIVAIVVSGVVGEMVARFYSEPLNRSLRGKEVSAVRPLAMTA